MKNCITFSPIFSCEFQKCENACLSTNEQVCEWTETCRVKEIDSTDGFKTNEVHDSCEENKKIILVENKGPVLKGPSATISADDEVPTSEIEELPDTEENKNRTELVSEIGKGSIITLFIKIE